MEKVGNMEEKFKPENPDDFGRVLSPKSKIFIYNEQDLAEHMTNSTFLTTFLLIRRP